MNNKSREKWEREIAKAQGNRATYSVSSHCTWCNEKNFRITHFGLSPVLFDFDHIRFDFLYLKLSIKRKIMSYVRDYLKKPFELQLEFTTFLKAS